MSFRDRLRLDGRAALVTGAAAGIGLATSRTIAAQGGGPLWLVDLDADALAAAATDISGTGVEVHTVVADAADYDAVAASLTAAPPIALLVNTAGNVAASPFHELGLDEWNETLDSHVKSCFVTSRILAPGMIGLGHGRIVNVASVAGKRGGGFLGRTAYAAAKAAINGFTKAVARELAPHGIRVNSVNPGLTDTRRVEVLQRDPEVWARCLAAVPLGRMAEPDEVASAILWLLSDASPFVTGETMNVDGGIAME